MSRNFGKTVNEAVKPLSWLIGHWKSIKAEGVYPTIEPFSYCEEMVFESIGQPLLNYTSRTWHPEKGNPMHLESGFLRINPGTNNIAFMIAHNFGVTSLEEGVVTNTTLKCKSTHISRMTFARDPPVLALEREFKLVENGNLEITVYMETSKTPLTQHLKALYEKM
ncbi:peroxynitrite isomerase THAP4-like [Tribolium madens]|uniref:peroxynitrite isomerase THAP4-like n=1 Tax=Tribolium madens TaxID=41895 RepID=UPI001CF73784|nr:peroxynitrite isomerase THAP4-like [Tribolium madens]